MHILHCLLASNVVQMLTFCSFKVSRILFGVTIDFVISPIIIFSSSISRPTHGCPTNDLVNTWLWVPHINFTIHPSPPNTGFTHSLKGQPHFLLLVTIRTKSFFYDPYFQLLSQPIKTNKVISLFPVFVSDLIITVTKPISYATLRTHCNTSSLVANNYKMNNICLVLGHSFAYFEKI